MFLTAEEVTNNMYGHVINNITQNDSQIVEQAIGAAVEEMSSYLSVRYNVNAIFLATGANRNPLILENTKVITVWNILKLAASETLYETWKERYDRVIGYLTKVAQGEITPSLPLKTNADGSVVIKSKFGSNPKFKHSL